MSTPIDPPLSRRAARQSEVTAPDAQPAAFAPPLTRRARASAPASAPTSAPTWAPGEVSYRTEVRPRVPHYDAPPVGHAVHSPEGLPLVDPGSMAPAAASVSPSAFVAPPLVEPPVAPGAVHAGEQMRRRDFRPPIEQPPSPIDQSMPPSADPMGGDAPLEYHTQVTAGLSESMGYSPASGAPVDSAPIEQTLSRRELRELRDRSGPPMSESTAATAATAAFGASASFVGEPVAVPAPLDSPPPLDQPPSLQQHTLASVYEPPPTHSSVYDQPVFDQPVFDQPVFDQPVFEQPMTPAPTALPDASSSVSPSPSTGSHWSVGINDDDDPFENTFSREVGSAVSLSNTNALVLPEMPVGGISGPVAGTGEIIITGMIDLPRMVSSTGTVPTVHESPDIDDLFDPGDLAAGPADAAPVSALKAISSHTAARSVITTGKRSSTNTVTTILVASTVVMAVVAIGLFVLAAVNGLF